MKKILSLVALLLLAGSAIATTLSPVQLLNPTGSTAGQAIISTGASSAPMWGNISISTLTGVLPVANGGTNASSASGTALDNITGFAGTGFLTRTGAGTYAFQSTTNGITLGNIAQVGANTVLGNATGSTANVSALSVPSCSTSSSAVQWTSASGWGCNASINAATLGSSTFAAPGPIGATTASSGAFTTLSASSTVSGAGFSTYLASPPAIGTTAAAAGKFTTLQATSTITPSSTAGIVGTTTNDNANAGSAGELQSGASGSSVSMTSNTAVNLYSQSLSAGDWDVEVTGDFVPAGTTVLTGMVIGFSTTSATLGGFGTYTQMQGTLGTGLTQVIASPVSRLSLSSSTTVYCVGLTVFATSTLQGSCNFRARRVR